MEFSGEALKGILDALPSADLANLCEDAKRRGVFGLALGSEERRAAIQQLLIENGYILPFESPVTDLGAAEYDEAIAAQTLMEDVCGS